MGQDADGRTGSLDTNRMEDTKEREREIQRRAGTAMARVMEAVEGAGQDRSESDLASEACQSLCYDFPLVSTAALAALASVFSKSLLTDQLPSFQVTASFVAGVCYMAHSTHASREPRSPFADVTLAGSTDDHEQCARMRHIHTLAGCVLVKLPAFGLKSSRQDSGVIIRTALESYRPQIIYSNEAAGESEENNEAASPRMQQSREGENQTVSEGAEQELASSDALADEQDDDDTEWEALEETLSMSSMSLLQESRTSPGSAVSLTVQQETPSWPNLIAKFADLSRQVQFETMNSPQIWSTLQLVDSVLVILESMLRIGHQQPLDGEAELQIGLVIRAYSDLLCEHLVTHPDGGSNGKDNLGKVFSRILNLVGAIGNANQEGREEGALPKAVQADGQRLALQLLSSCCTRLPGGTDRMVGRKEGIGREISRTRDAAAMAKQQLWSQVGAALPWLGSYLATMSTQKMTNSEWLGEIGRLLVVLVFYIKNAPGNAQLGEALLESGVCRAAVGLFVRTGEAPAMEALRSFVLLAAVAAPEFASYAAAVPTFSSVLKSESFSAQSGPAGPHGLLWPLVLNRTPGNTRETDVEAPLAELLEDLTQQASQSQLDYVQFSVAASYLQRVLALLHEAAIVARGPKTPLWRKTGRLSGALTACQLAVRDAATRESLLQDSRLSESMNHERPDVSLNDAREPCSPAGETPEVSARGSKDESQLIGSIETLSSLASLVCGREEPSEESLEDRKKEEAQASGLRRGQDIIAEEARKKTRELLPRLAGQLKPLLLLSKGGVSVVKND